MKEEQSPIMSVIITIGSGYESVRTTIEYLRIQTVKVSLEGIIMSPTKKCSAPIEAEFKDFYNTILIEADIDNDLYEAWVNAIRRSSAPVVVLGANHAFPEPYWAEPLLIEAHKGPWAGVGCVIKNANPDVIKNCAQHYMIYGRFTEPVESGEIDDPPGYISSYKRSVLLDYRSKIKFMLVRTNIMYMNLRSWGYRLYVEYKPKTDHINISITLSILLDLLYNGQLYKAALTFHKRWSPFKRLLYAILEPLIIFKHFRGTLQNIRRTGQWDKLIPVALPILVLGLTAHLLG